MYEMTKLDWGVMALFFVVMIGIGLFTSVLIKNTKDYFTGGGKMPWWLLGVSHHVSGYSAVAFTAYAAIAYTTGFTVYIWWAVPISLACFVGIFWIVSRWSRLRTQYNMESPLEYLATRYNVPTQQILAWWGVLLKILDVGAKWVAVALVITTFAPKISFANAVFLSVGLGLFYSTIGGLWAGTLTDFAMFIVQFVSGISMLVVVLARLGGVSALWTMWDQPALQGHLAPMAGEYGTWSCIIGLFLINVLGYNGGTWNLAQRFIAAPQGSDAKKAALLSAALYLIWPLVLFVPMWACPLLLPDLPQEQLNQSYCLMVVKFLPPGLTGLMLAALVSHTLTMTTADATAITSVLVRDVFPKICPPIKNASQRGQLLTARAVTVVFMLLTTVVALANRNFGGILGIVLDWFSALLGPVSIAMILGLLPWFRHCGVGATLSSLVAGIGVFIAMKFLPDMSTGMAILVPTVVSFVVYTGVGFLSMICGMKVPSRVNHLLSAISTDKPLTREYTVDSLTVKVFPNRKELGKAAGHAAAEAIRQAIAHRGEARVIFAAAPSQNETLETLRHEPGIDWTKVTALHMDEYVGLPVGSPARFASYLNEHIFRHLPFKEVFLLDDPSLSLSSDAAVSRYKKIIADGPIDVVCMGIGENGHIAFNDPAVARFGDPESVKVVDLDDVCRMQQVHDGCFPTLDDVPRQAITLTVPTLFSGAALICAVPGTTKRAAVRQTLTGVVDEVCPATILRCHTNATLFVDTESCDVSADAYHES